VSPAAPPPELVVGFDVTSAVKARRRGIATYVASLLAALPAAAPELQPVLLIRHGRWFRRRLVADILPAAPRRWLLDPLPAPARGLDLVHGLGVRLPARCPVPRVVTLHDLRGLDAVEWTDPRWVRIRAARLRQTLVRAEAVICDSAFVRERLHHHFPAFPRERSCAVPLGLDHARFRPPPPEEVDRVRRRYGLDRPWLLQVGLLSPHKNPEATLHALAGSPAARDHLLVLAGGDGAPGYRESLEALARHLGLAPRVRWLGSLPAGDLPALYGGADLVLVPSHYEGFGLPVLEAMACGAAGVAADAASLPEVAGGAWPLAPPGEPEAWAGAVEILLADPERRRQVAEAARARARAFSWAATARATAAWLRRVAAAPAPG